jgi:DNA-binding transcriptional LysR family regulator
MDLYQLKTFYTLARTKSFTRCAQELFITQSAVSHAIRKLENSLDQTLVIRKGSRFQLSASGKELFESCAAVFPELERARKKIRLLGSRPEPLSLGSVMEFGATVLMKNMTGFFRLHPDLHVDFTLIPEPLEPFLNDEFDIMVDCRDHTSPLLLKTRLFRETYAVIAAPELLAGSPVDQVRDLERCTVLSMDREGAWWNNFLHALHPGDRIRFNRVIMINHVRGIINACLSGLGVGFVPRYTVLRELEEGSLVSLFPDLRLLEDNFYIYVKRNHPDLDHLQLLVGYIQGLEIE